MINIQDIQKVFLIGIGGIGMSVLARYFHEQGCHVSGYDRTPSQLTGQLENSGIAVYYANEVQEDIKNANLIIYTPAIPKDNEFYSYALNNKPLYKRSEVLQMILQNMDCIAVAGTHGKTTISCMIAHILRDSGFGCNAFLGGIAANYNTNYWSDKRPLAVVEADEYDRSFLRLSPNKAVLTAMDADHLDIYGTAEKLEQAFVDFTNKITPDGLLIYNCKLKKEGLYDGGKKWNYALTDETASVYARNITVSNGEYIFDAVLQNKEVIHKVQLPLGGRYNIENTLAAIAVCYDLGVHPEQIKNAMATFNGVKRRFEYVIKEDDRIYIDDYAHHPEELKGLLSGVKELFPGQKCTVVFQPHLYSRTRDLATAFAKAIDLADQVILLPVYPAREAPIAGVTSKLIADLINKNKVQLCKKEELCNQLMKDKSMVTISAGAGDIGAMVEDIKKCLSKKAYNKTNVC